jgi:hypothetical protein
MNSIDVLERNKKVKIFILQSKVFLIGNRKEQINFYDIIASASMVLLVKYNFQGFIG